MKYCNKLGQIESEIIDCAKAMMTKESGVYAYAILQAMKKLSSKGEVNYYLGIYYLEYGRIYWGMRGRYFEGKVSFRRARKCLKTALRHKPQNADILLAIGESYFKERRYGQAQLYFCKAYERGRTNSRFLWCLMEVSYLLKEYEKVSILFEQFDWDRAHDRTLTFWAGILATYAAAQQKNSRKMQEYLNAVGDVPQGMADYDVAIISMLELYYLTGDIEGMHRIYDSNKSDVKYIDSPCKDMLEATQFVSIRNPAIEQELLASFTPLRLVPHFEW